MSEKKLSSLEKLKAQQTKLKAQIQKMESRKKVSDRKIDTRRKILVGSYFLDKFRDDNKFNELVELMDSYLKRTSDRVLFALNTIEPE